MYVSVYLGIIGKVAGLDVMPVLSGIHPQSTSSPGAIMNVMPGLCLVNATYATLYHLIPPYATLCHFMPRYARPLCEESRNLVV
jgi:hypothetical protein